MREHCAKECSGEKFHDSEQTFFKQRFWIQLRTNLRTCDAQKSALVAISSALVAPAQARAGISSVLAAPGQTRAIQKTMQMLATPSWLRLKFQTLKNQKENHKNNHRKSDEKQSEIIIIILAFSG